MISSMSIPSSSSPSSVRHISTIETAIAHCAKHCSHTVLSRGFIPTRLLFVGTNQDATVRVEITNTIVSNNNNNNNNPAPSRDVNFSGTDQRDRNDTSNLKDNSKYRYAALSYCWGPPTDAETQCTTTTLTLASRQSKLARDGLSPILLDAITVTRRLGLSYLWIDSLCILQDDVADWEAESAMMGRIYSNAWVTIIGLGSQSCRVGFLDGRWSDSKYPSGFDDGKSSCSSENGTSSDEQDEPATGQDDVKGSQENKKLHGDVALAAQVGQSQHPECQENGSPDSTSSQDHEGIDAPSPWAWEFASAMAKSRWSTRGWTFQEKALSTRLLYFDRTNIHLRCANYTFREGTQEPLLKKQLAFLEPTDHAEVIPEQVGGSGFEMVESLRRSGQVVEGLLESWRNIFIPRFATCEFSRRADNLPAISGLARYVAEASGYRYAAGLWVEDLGRELVWYGSGRGRLGTSRKNNHPPSGLRLAGLGLEDLVDWLSDREEYIAPSWSWAREGGGMERLDFLDIPTTTTTTKAADRKENANVVATFDVKVDLKGLNPYGQVTGGDVAIVSKVLPLLPEEYAMDSSGFEMDWVVDDNCRLSDGLEMVLIGIYDANVWMGPGLQQLQRRAYGLVVYPSSVIPGKYYRVGMFCRPDLGTGCMDSESARQRTIAII